MEPSSRVISYKTVALSCMFLAMEVPLFAGYSLYIWLWKTMRMGIIIWFIGLFASFAQIAVSYHPFSQILQISRLSLAVQWSPDRLLSLAVRHCSRHCPVIDLSLQIRHYKLRHIPGPKRDGFLHGHILTISRVRNSEGHINDWFYSLSKVGVP